MFCIMDIQNQNTSTSCTVTSNAVVHLVHLYIMYTMHMKYTSTDYHTMTTCTLCIKYKYYNSQCILDIM